MPNWIGTQAALGWGELAGQAAARRQQAYLEQQRMSQEAAQAAADAQIKQAQLAQAHQQAQAEFAAKFQAGQEQLQKENLMEQQKIAIDQAYKQTVTGLRQQDLDLAQKEFDAKAQHAAQIYAAGQRAQKAILPKEQGGEGLSPEQAYLREFSGLMTPDAAASLAQKATPFIPKSIEIDGQKYYEDRPEHYVPEKLKPDPNAPRQIPGEGGHWERNPDTGVLHWVPQKESSGLEEMIQKYEGSKGKGGDTREKILPLPKNKSDLKEGQFYNTSRGPAKWDGEKFTSIGQQLSE